MPNLNRVTLIGHLGRDPEVRYMPNGDAVCNFSIATTRKWKSKEGEKKEDTQWTSISSFGKLAEIAGKYLNKGAPVYVEGWLRTRKWQDKNGQDRYTTEVVMEQMQLLGEKRRQEEESAPSPAPQSGATSYDDDDVPFLPRSHRSHNG